MLTNTSLRDVLRTLRYAHALFKGLVVVFLLTVLLNQFVITGFRVQGHSMDPTLHNQQLLPVLEAAHWFLPPRRGEVVIVQYAGDSKIRFVKRVIGIPGDKVEIQGQEVLLGPGQFYVLGDNRDHSTDSRVFGAVQRSQIIGKVLGQSAYVP